MAEHEDSLNSSTTTSTTTATSSPPPPPPPLPSSSSSSSSPPSSHRPYSGAATSFHHGGFQGEVSDFRSSSAAGHARSSPAMCNGYGTSSPPRHSKEEANVQSSGDAGAGERGGRETRSGNPSSNPTPLSLDTAGAKDLPQVPLVVKQERDQDGPLDFSVRRRDSVSESFTDDSRASSSISPPSYSGVGGPQAYSSSTSLQHSPEAEPLHLAAAAAAAAAAQAVAPPPPLPQRPSHPHRHHSGSSHSTDGADPFHKLPQMGRSPGSSPDRGDLLVQPKALSKHPGGKMGSRSPVNSSLAALGMMAEGGAGGGMTPAALAAMAGQNGGLMGHMGNLSPFMAGDFRKMVGSNGGKVQRPFKAYPKEALQMPLGYLGLPGINPFPGLDYNSLQGLPLNQEEMMSLYKQQLDFMKEREKQMMSMNKMSSRSPPSSSSTSSSSTSTSSSSFGPSNANGSSNSRIPPTPPPLPPPPPLPQSSLGHSSHPVHHQSLSSSVSAAAAAASSYFPPSSHSSTASSLPPHNNNSNNNNNNNTSSGYSHIPSSTSSSSSHFPAPTVPPLVSSTSSITGGGSRKRPRSLPDEQKDDAYWERRRKNNDAAKRSRDARRAKEDEIALRAALLEQENLKLRVEVAALKTETARLRCMLYNS